MLQEDVKIGEAKVFRSSEGWSLVRYDDKTKNSSSLFRQEGKAKRDGRTLKAWREMNFSIKLKDLLEAV